jgi:hypothetical protein
MDLSGVNRSGARNFLLRSARDRGYHARLALGRPPVAAEA